MKKLTADLKRMLDGLARQDAAEFLPLNEKMQFIGRDAAPRVAAPEPHVNGMQPTAVTVRKIAVVINKGSTDSAFDHAMQACQRLGARLDLLLSGPVSRERMARMEASLQRAGVSFQAVYLSGPVARAIADYAERLLSLIYLVAAEDDPDINELVEQDMPARRRTLPVPLVLIGGRPERRMATASAL